MSSTTATAVPPAPVIQITQISVDALRVSAVNPRRDPGDIEDLAASIHDVGVIEPLIVTPAPESGVYLVLAGSRRLTASRSLGLESVPCIIRVGLSEIDREALMVSENLHRRDLLPSEEATVYARMKQLFGLSQEQIGRKVGRSQPHVGRYLALLRLPAEVVRAVDQRNMGLYEALGIGRYSERKRSAPARRDAQGRRPKCTFAGHRSCVPAECEIVSGRTE